MVAGGGDECPDIGQPIHRWISKILENLDSTSDAASQNSVEK